MLSSDALQPVQQCARLPVRLLILSAGFQGLYIDDLRRMIFPRFNIQGSMVRAIADHGKLRGGLKILAVGFGFFSLFWRPAFDVRLA